MTQYPDLFTALAAPFESAQVKARTQGARQVHYITARTAMNRLDEVLGPENWWDEYVPSENSVLCRLTVRMPDGSTLTKADAGGYAGMPDQGDDDKSGFSDAFKRAAVKFGVGRYLYRDGVPTFVRERVNARPAPVEPQIAAGTEPETEPAAREPKRWGGPPPAGSGSAEPGKCPGSGRGLFARLKEIEQTRQIGLLKYVNAWAKLQELPGRMVDWDRDQVELAWGEVRRKLASIGDGEALAS